VKLTRQSSSRKGSRVNGRVSWDLWLMGCFVRIGKPAVVLCLLVMFFLMFLVYFLFAVIGAANH
jgi:hypothetical protein